MTSPLTAQTMLLAAGLGTRVQPMTRHRPKAFLPVGDSPLLQQIARQLRSLGENSAGVNCHWKTEYFLSNIKDISFTFHVSCEENLLGSAGGIAAARRHLQAPFAVWNADIVIGNPPLEALRQRAEASRGVCLCVAPSQGPGTVGLDGDGRVVRLRGETFGKEIRAMDYVGLCGLSAAAVDQLPAEGCLIGDLCLPLLRRGASICTLETTEAWQDIGSIAGYYEANRAWLRAHRGHASSHVALSAKVEPTAQIQDCIVGEAARVIGHGLIDQCVVWPGATARAPLSRCIVTPDEIVPVA